MSHIFHYFKNLPKIRVKICTPSNKCFPSINCLQYNMCNYQAPPNALILPKLAGDGSFEKPSTPGVAAPTKGVVSC